MNAKRWLIVAAVSTKGKGQTVEQQVGALQERARREGAEVVDVLEFRKSRYKEGSALDVERRVLDRVAGGDVDVVAAWCLDRVTRRGPLAALELLRTLEDHHRVQFYSLQEPFLSTATMDASIRGLLLPLFAWIAEQESRRRGDRLVAKAETKRNRAEALGQRARWGKGVMPMEADVAEVWRLRDLNLGAYGGPTSVRAIAAETGLSKSTVDRIVRAGRPTTSVPLEPEGHGQADTVETAPSDLGGLGQ